MSRAAALVLALGLLAGCASTGRTNVESPGAAAVRRHEEGLASWYGARFHGRRTASGERFDRHALVAAHPTLPFGSRVRVRRAATGASVVVRIVDRGPAAALRKEVVVIDLSEAAAKRLGFLRDGRTAVRLDVLSLGTDDE